MKKPKLILIIHNVRSAHNVGSLLRTADGIGLVKVWIGGYSPYPESLKDNRLPHVSQKATRLIHKTALGAEESVAWQHYDNLAKLIDSLRKVGYIIAALEQANKSVTLQKYLPSEKIALIVGNEIDGIDKDTLDRTDICLEIPMQGNKESYNVAVAGAIALYHLRWSEDIGQAAYVPLQ